MHHGSRAKQYVLTGAEMVLFFVQVEGCTAYFSVSEPEVHRQWS